MLKKLVNSGFPMIFLQSDGGGDSGSRVPPIVFEDVGADDEEEEPIDFLVEGEDEIPPEPTEDEDLPEDLRGKSKKELAEELQAYKGQADTSKALTGAIEKLGEKLATPERPQQQTVKDIKKSLKDDPDFAARFNKEVFGEDPFTVIADLVEKLSDEKADQKIAQALGPMAQSAVDMQLNLIKQNPIDKQLYEEFQLEFQQQMQVLEAQQPGAKSNPRAYKYVMDQIKLNHIDRYADIVNEQKQPGKKTEEPKEVPKAQFSERGGAAPAAKSSGKKQIIVQGWEREICAKRGIPVDYYAIMKSEGKHFNKAGDMVGVD